MKKQDGCDCEQCRECCTRESGWFLPEEILPAATFLNMTEENFISTMCAVHETETTKVLAPKMKQTGCIFFEHGKCKIHPVKPYECRKVFGCDPPRRHQRIRDMIRQTWEKEYG